MVTVNSLTFVIWDQILCHVPCTNSLSRALNSLLCSWACLLPEVTATVLHIGFAWEEGSTLASGREN